MGLLRGGPWKMSMWNSEVLFYDFFPSNFIHLINFSFLVWMLGLTSLDALFFHELLYVLWLVKM